MVTCIRDGYRWCEYGGTVFDASAQFGWPKYGSINSYSSTYSVITLSLVIVCE